MIKIKNKKTLILLITFVAMAITAVSFILVRQFRGGTPSPNPIPGVNMSPATEQEMQESYALKERSAQKGSHDPGTNKGEVKPIIIDAGMYGSRIEVRAFIPGIREDIGTCTFLFTNQSNRVVKTSVGVADVSSTRCTNIEIPVSEFQSKGEWTLVIDYSSPTYFGKSEGKAVSIN